jgi:hypothetical protein
MNLKETIWEEVDWIDLAQDKTFRAIVMAELTRRVL